MSGCAKELTDDATCPESHDVRRREWKGVGRNADCEVGVARLTRLMLYAIAIGGALVLLSACARQEQPTPTPGGIRLSARTPLPSRLPVSVSSPSPSPSVEPVGEPLLHTLTITDPDPSAADLAIQVIPGGTSVYTLTVRNLGPDPATGIVLTDVLPSGVTPLWTEPAQPVCGRQERNVGCDLGDLQAGDAATVTLDLTVSGSESLITGTQLAGVTLDLSRPTCALEQDSSPPQVMCHLSRLPAGAEAQVRVAIGVDDPTSGALIHTSTVTAHETDPDLSNNRVISTMTVGVAAPVAVTASPTAADLVIQANGPGTVIAGQPFTYTYIITNRGASDATGVWFEDVVPADLDLLAYVPGLPLCERQDDALTCYLRDLDSGETVSFTLIITGYGEQPIQMGLDALMPGWPICSVLKERTWLHIVQCELGELQPSQATRVQLVLEAIGAQERTTANTASVGASVTDLNPVDNTITTTIAIQVHGTPGED
jgi:uncharacterized repeat protein (TIGR01451 family)